MPAHTPQHSPAPPDWKVATRAIIRRIRTVDAELRDQHTWLQPRHQDRMGLLFYGLSWAWMATIGVSWSIGLCPWWLAVPGIALGLSILHELEHDLIHDLYFAQRPRLQDALFTGIWLAKMSLNPWSRRRLHRYHHKVSGQPEDIEERLIGLGLPWGFRRLLLSVLPAGSLVVVPAIRRSVIQAVRDGAPRPNLHHARGFGLIRAVDGVFLLAPFVVLPLALRGDPVAVALLVLWVLPNTIRHFSIVVVSSNSHYTGIPRGTLFPQNQVLDHPALLPLQLFCFNFGATHILHHFVVKQPFYLRQLVSARVRDTLRENGVPFNDLGTFVRANRRPPSEPVST